MNATIPIRLDTNSVIGKNTTSSTLTFSDLLLNHGSTNTAAVYMIRKDNPNIDYNIYKALDNVNLNCVIGTKIDGEYESFLAKYDNKSSK